MTFFLICQKSSFHVAAKLLILFIRVNPKRQVISLSYIDLKKSIISLAHFIVQSPNHFSCCKSSFSIVVLCKHYGQLRVEFCFSANSFYYKKNSFAGFSNQIEELVTVHPQETSGVEEFQYSILLNLVKYSSVSRRSLRVKSHH